MTEPSTRERLLNAAEELIADQGYANTSLREVTHKAEANLAAVNYHFGSKEGLLSAMLERRLKPMNAERMAQLEKVLKEAADKDSLPDATRLLRCFIEPVIRFFQSEAGGKHYLRIFSRIHADPDDTIRREFLKHMIPVFIGFFNGFREALPGIAPEKLAPRILFCIGAMGHGVSVLVDEEMCKRATQLGIPVSLDSNALVEELIGFASRGLEAE